MAVSIFLNKSTWDSNSPAWQGFSADDADLGMLCDEAFGRWNQKSAEARHKEAYALVAKNWSKVKALAQALSDRQTLSRREAIAIIKSAGR